MGAYQGAAAFKRISNVIDKKIQIRDDFSLPKLQIKNSDINFKNVSFNYNSTDEKAIKNININIKGNTMTAFVGHSGAGKSTIINLLPRFYDPQEGIINIDNQNKDFIKFFEKTYHL